MHFLHQIELNQIEMVYRGSLIFSQPSTKEDLFVHTKEDNLGRHKIFIFFTKQSVCADFLVKQPGKIDKAPAYDLRPIWQLVKPLYFFLTLLKQKKNHTDGM